MRVGIPVENNVVAREYSDAKLFALYDVDDETRRVRYVGRETLAECGCAKTPVELRRLGVEMVIAHEVSQNGVNHLLEYGILTAKDVEMISPDAIMAHLVSGTLKATSPEAAIHKAGAGSCGNGGCEHCSHTH